MIWFLHLFSIHLTSMNYKYSCKELIAICKTNGIKGYNNKKKQELIDLIKSITTDTAIATHPAIETDTAIAAIINKGTGAGGANTNYYGKQFEEKTNNEKKLLEIGYTLIKKTIKAYDYYLSKTFEDKTVVFALQNGVKHYMKNKYNIDLFRCPDEAYIIECTSGRKIIKILEKKEQNVEGSVETKLWSGPSLKREYELILGPEFEVFYGFCVNNFLKNKIISNEKKYTTLNTILEDENYFETLDTWFNNSL
jgi:hypothetical protein